MKKHISFLIALSLVASFAFSQKKKEFIYVGTYSVRGSKGIYVFELDRAKGTLVPVATYSNLKSPSFLALHPSGKFLYAVSELNETGGVGAFSLNPATGTLTFINQQSSQGNGSCHISIDQTGAYAFVSNYSAGSLAVLPIKKDGSLQVATDVIKHEGSSINKERQEGPHVHSAFVSPDNKYVFVSDLGLDTIFRYELNHSSGKINKASTQTLAVAPGAGPRHLVFHPDGKHMYSAEELYSAVGVFTYNTTSGATKLIKDTVRSLPVTFKAFNKSADIHTDPSGKFLYMSNRGLDALAIYDIKPDGSIALKGQQDVMGKAPRNFLVDPKGEFVFVANQDSDNIVIFALDKKTGMLTYTGNQTNVPAPVCLTMLSN